VASTNVELVRSILADWERGDYSHSEWAHPEIEFVFADGPAPGRWTGLAGMTAANRDWLSAWEDLRQEVEEVRELDLERTLVLHRFAASGRGSGLDVGRIRAEGAAVFHIRARTVIRLVHYFDRGRALDDLGLLPNVDPPRS
jgi:ketosteroid isomerase-like protein